jgi:SAM-dependent methyltransferase
VTTTASALDLPYDAGLRLFFERLDRCKDKTAHVHGLHPYPAKFIPHIPRALTRALAREDDVVLDPMCGSGTTLVEANVAGHDAVGIDLNPIAALVSRAKTANLSAKDTAALGALASFLELAGRRLSGGAPVDLPNDDELPRFHNRDKWFERNVLRELIFVKQAILEATTGAARDLALCAFSACVVTVSNQESETRWAAKNSSAADGFTLRRVGLKLGDAVDRAATFRALRRGSTHVEETDARTLPLSDESVGVIVTSPPYANSHDYYLYNKLRMFLLEESVADVQQREIGSRHKHSDMKEDIGTYISAMSTVLHECRRVVRTGGALAVVVADAVVRKEFFSMNEIYDGIATEAGFVPEAAYGFRHRRYNATFQRGFGTKQDKNTHVLVYRAA